MTKYFQRKKIHFILRKLTLKYSLETFSTLEYFEMKRTAENIRRKIYMARSPRKNLFEFNKSK